VVRVPAQVLRTPRLAGAALTSLVRQPIMREHTMESQALPPAMYSLSPTDLIPPDDVDEDNADVQWLEYCRVASTLDRARILEVVLSDLDCDESPLYEFIDEAITQPHEPGHARDNIVRLGQLGQSLLNLIAKAVDDQVNLRMAVQQVPRD
jgi:hypothetical protein